MHACRPRFAALAGLASTAALTLLLAATSLGFDARLWSRGGARAQDLEGGASDPAMAARPEEREAFDLAIARRHLKARALAEKIVARDPNSYVGHLTLALVHHYGEASLPRALYHAEIALRAFEARWGAQPSTDQPWRWHARMLRELAYVHGDMGHHSEKLAYMARYNLLYDPDFIAERAWPLMKLRRFDEARAAAKAGVESHIPWERAVGYNALCAIEFEAGRDEESYEWCRRAADRSDAEGAYVSATDFTNFAEAARSLFLLDEAERAMLQATREDTAWYANPWVDLGELYLREGRFAEAVDSLRRVSAYRANRPPHVRDVDRGEASRALAQLFALLGRPADALRHSARALRLPDRSAHTSRDPAVDTAVAGLLDRLGRHMMAEHTLEEAASGSVWDRVRARVVAALALWEGWRSGRRVTRALADDERLIGIFHVGRSRGAILPPWLVGELVEVAGAGVVREAVRRARLTDRRERAPAYYDAVECEVALAQGDEVRAIELGRRALHALPPAEALLRARVHALVGKAAWRLGDVAGAARAYDAAWQVDPGLFRRLGIRLPVRFEAPRGATARAAVAALRRSPRLEPEDTSVFVVRATVEGGGGRICLLGHEGAVLGCGEAVREAGEDEHSLARRLVASFHARVFAPRVDLSQADVSSLDGANRTTRNPLEDIEAGDVRRGSPLDSE
jgi:tetratricopeptide (TPR) repeat protein